MTYRNHERESAPNKTDSDILQESGNIFCKGPNRIKYFRLCGPGGKINDIMENKFPQIFLWIKFKI